MKCAASACISLILAASQPASAAVRVSVRPTAPLNAGSSFGAAGAALSAGASLAPSFSPAAGLSLPGAASVSALPPSVLPSFPAPAQASRSASARTAAPSASVSAPAGLAGAAARTNGIAPNPIQSNANERNLLQPSAAPSARAAARTGQAASAEVPSLKDSLMIFGKLLKDKHFDPAFDGARPDDKGYDVDAFRVRRSARGSVDLSRKNSSDVRGFKDKGGKGNGGNKAALKLLAADTEALKVLQEQLYAGKGGKPRSVLIVLQAMDTGGKDGVLRHVLGPLDPQGVKVTSFKKPTQEEIDNGYLWRIKKALPEPGYIGVFNRSQYEDILVPTIMGGVDAKTIERRYAEINAFEKKLADEGVLILKFFLHIDKAEQKRRLQARLDDPTKQWKFDPNDLKMREKWDDFQKVYGKILARTSTAWAPWYLIPADNKWFRNFLVARIIRTAMEGLGLKYPDPPEGLGDIVIPD